MTLGSDRWYDDECVDDREESIVTLRGSLVLCPSLGVPPYTVGTHFF